MKELQDKKLPFTVLGNLTNVLPPDGESQTAVISTKMLVGVEETDGGVFAFSGVTSGGLLKACKSFRLSGAEFWKEYPVRSAARYI